MTVKRLEPALSDSTVQARAVSLGLELSEAQVAAIAAAVVDSLDGELSALVAAEVEALLADAGGGGWLTVTEVARDVGVHPRTVYRALRTGRLAGDRVGTRWRVRRTAVVEWVRAPAPAARTGDGSVRVARPRQNASGKQSRSTSFRERARVSRGIGPRVGINQGGMNEVEGSSHD